MTRYFDRDFFKFLMNFMAIVAFSLAIVVAAKHYEESKTNDFYIESTELTSS